MRSECPTVRRELLDHDVPIDEAHLRWLLLEYVEYDNNNRVHTVLHDAPATDEILKAGPRYDASPRFFTYDNDSIFSERVTETIKNIGIEPPRTAFPSPPQNGIAETRVG